MEFEAICWTISLGIGRETVLGLGNTDRELLCTQLLDLINHSLCRIAHGYAAGTIQIECYLLNLLFYRILISVSEVEWSRWTLIDGLHYELCQFHRTLATFGEGTVDSESATHLLTVLAQNLNLLVGIGSKLVEGDDNGLTEALKVLHVLVEVPVASFHSCNVRLFDIFLSYSTVHLQCLESNNENSKVWLQASLAALDVVELLSTEVSTESSLCDSIVAIFEGSCCSHDGIASMGNVSKRTAVNEGRSALGSLNQVWLQGIEEEGNDTATYTHILDGEWFVILSDAEENIVDATTEIVYACCETHDSHDFRSRSDVESSLCLDAVLVTDTGNDATQATVVDVHHTAPEYLLELESLSLVLETVVVQEGSNHVVSLSDGMEVASEMEVDLIHRQYLSITAAGSTTLHAEARTERRLAQCNNCLLANLLHTEGETHGYGGLSITSLGRTDSGNEDEMMVLKLVSVNFVRSNLSDVTAVVFYLVFMDSKFCSYLIDRAQFY